MSKLPPIPPENRSPKGPGEPDTATNAAEHGGSGQLANPDKAGQSGNTKVNTVHQGHQQDR